jgi:hypothetical protein
MRFIWAATGILLFGTFASEPAAAARYWLGGVDPIVLRGERQQNSTDYMSLFQPGAPWANAASKLSVFKVSAQFVLGAPDAMLRTVFENMRERHVQMAVEMGAVVRLDPCGLGEGYAPADMPDRIGRRLHNLNLTLDYMAADEPVWYTHEKTWGAAKNGAPNCAYPLTVVAQRVGMSVNSLRRYFPSIQVGDIEPVGSGRISQPQLVADYAQFTQLLEGQIGQRLAFFHADVAWHTDWLPMIAPLKRQMHALGVPFGVIIGGSPENTSEEEWVRTGLQRLEELNRNPATRPDDVVIQSWQRFPTHMLPESAPGTSTYLLLQAQRASG